MRPATRSLFTLLFALLSCAARTHAAVVVDQPAGPGDYISQILPDRPLYSTITFDDFQTTQAYHLTSLTVPGTETGDLAQNLAVTANILTGAPGSSVLQSFSGTEGVDGTLQFNLGGYALTAGSYWLSAYVTRDYTPGGQWFIDTTSTVNGSQAEVQNIGGGYGFGTAPVTFTVALGSPQDIAFTLSGNAVPEPSTIILFGLGALGLFAVARRRRAA